MGERTAGAIPRATAWAGGAALAVVRETGEALAPAVSARLLFLAAFVCGRMLVSQPLVPWRSYEVPGLRPLVQTLSASSSAYGDYGWYRQLATSGYDAVPFSAATQHNWAFFPLGAALFRLFPLHQFVFGEACFFGGVVLLYWWVRREWGAERGVLACRILAFFPFSYVLAQFRPDAALFTLGAAALLLAQAKRPWAAGSAGLVAGFSKPNAFLIAAPLLHYLARRPRWSTLWVLAAPAVGIVALSVYLHRLTGEALAWAKIQSAWGGAFFVRPWNDMVELALHPHLVDRGGWDPALLNWAVVVAIIAAVVALWRSRLRLFALYLAAVAGLTFLDQGVITLGKHISECPPFFLGLALLLGRRGVRTYDPLAAGLLALMGLCNGAGLFFTMF